MDLLPLFIERLRKWCRPESLALLSSGSDWFVSARVDPDVLVVYQQSDNEDSLPESHRVTHDFCEGFEMELADLVIVDNVTRHLPLETTANFRESLFRGVGKWLFFLHEEPTDPGCMIAEGWMQTLEQDGFVRDETMMTALVLDLEGRGVSREDLDCLVASGACGLFRREVAVNGAWACEDATAHYHDEGLAAALLAFLKCEEASSIADLGCGAGSYSRLLIDSGFKVFACDGNPNTERLTGGLGICVDLGCPHAIVEHDWVISLEVGEHLPPWLGGTFLDNVVKAARMGVVLSWAVPGQGGFGHLNERSNVWVKEEMGRRGFLLDEGRTGSLREAAVAPWFPASLMVFRRDVEQACLPE